MNTPLKPMDIYADMEVPFDIAAYCRGHKFCVQAAALTKALHERDNAKAEIDMAEKRLDAARVVLKDRIAAVRVRMEGDIHV